MWIPNCLCTSGMVNIGLRYFSCSCRMVMIIKGKFDEASEWSSPSKITDRSTITMIRSGHADE